MNIIHNKKFINITGDLTKKFQKALRKNINECPHIIQKHEKWKHVNLHPYPSIIRGLIKIHKTDYPIRPIVNWKEAPAYKLVTMLTKKLGILIPLPYILNIKNTNQLMEDLDIPFDKDLKFFTFDIENTNSNISITEITKIIEVMCKQNRLNMEIKNEIIKTCNILTKENYFQYEDLQYRQEDGLAMGAPTSSILSEIYLQYLENTKIFDILLKQHIIGYFRYVDDILIVYKNGMTNIHDMLDTVNKITPTMTFTMEEVSTS
jgi:hypothetical protein